jgi:hypothetical protein
VERLRVVRRPRRYAIVVRGELDAQYAAAFDEMTVSVERGRTHLVGEVIDQSHLYGLLDRIASLGIELISVNPLPDEGGES